MPNRLRHLREWKRLTQEELAEVAGVDQTTISAYERGSSRIPDELNLRLAEYFGVSAAHLMGWDRDENNNDTTVPV